jgi:hypothetical protein
LRRCRHLPAGIGIYESAQQPDPLRRLFPREGERRVVEIVAVTVSADAAALVDIAPGQVE